MSWIKEIPYEAAEGKLKKIYDRVKGPDNNVDNILMAHSLRPHSLTGHMGLYKNVIHNSANTVPKWFLETIGVYVSILNRCDYCVDHHFSGLKRLLRDEEKSGRIMDSFRINDVSKAFEGKYLLGLQYAEKLTTTPFSLVEADIEKLRLSGWHDGEILEINQVTSYFNYANRTVLGLGVDTKGDIIGLSPNESDDPNDWGHK